MRAATIVLMMAGALALSACDQIRPKTSAPQSASHGADCAASAQAAWTTPGGPLQVLASGSGPSCKQAVALLVIRSADGEAKHVAAYPISTLFGFEQAVTPVSLQSALQSWIAVDSSPLHTSADLPTWSVGAEQPDGGEYPFYPDEGFADRTAYEELRGQNLPIYCYPQGMESMSCVVLREGQLETVGVQTFPG